MFRATSDGWDILVSSIKAFRRHPGLLTPMLICWAIYAPLIIYLEFKFPWEQFSLPEIIGILFATFLTLAFIYSWSAFALLELIKQIETKSPVSLLKALGNGTLNVIVALPIVVCWALLWLTISLIEIVFSKVKDDKDRRMTARNVAKTLAGSEGMSLSGAFFSALKKGVRMTAFMMYPAIAWENMGPFQSMKRGLGVMRIHKGIFAAGFVLTGLTAAIVFIPPGLLFLYTDKTDTTLPDIVWFWTIVYCALAWSFSLFIEQMFVAELYLWHLIWERKVREAKRKGSRSLPSLRSVHRPSIIDDYPDWKRTEIYQSENPDSEN